MALTISEIDDLLEGLANNPQVDYTIGDKTVSAGQKMKQLLALRKHLMENPEAEVEMVAFDVADIDQFGGDHTQTVK